VAAPVVVVVCGCMCVLYVAKRGHLLTHSPNTLTHRRYPPVERFSLCSWHTNKPNFSEPRDDVRFIPESPESVNPLITR